MYLCHHTTKTLVQLYSESCLGASNTRLFTANLPIVLVFYVVYITAWISVRLLSQTQSKVQLGLFTSMYVKQKTSSFNLNIYSEFNILLRLVFQCEGTCLCDQILIHSHIFS